MKSSTRRAVAVAILAGVPIWAASSALTGVAAQAPRPNPHEKGATYYSLEAKTGRLTTRYADGREAVADRDMAGAVHTVVRDRAGNELARRLHAAQYTLDVASRQTTARDDRDVTELVTEWSDGLTATLTRQNFPRSEISKGRFVQGPALVSDLSANGVLVGRGIWFVDDQVYAYRFAGDLGSAYIAPEHLKQHYGGWGFAPDTTWVNLQTIALYHFSTLMKAKGKVAKNCVSPQPSRLAQFFFPTVQANEPGCDGLHWLDGTLLRACCDDHDRCYGRTGCNATSWWRPWSSWTCDFCNMEVVSCFLGGGSASCGLMRLAC